MNKTYQFTIDEKANALAAPVSRQGCKTFDFSYYTLCKISDVIKRTFPTPATLARYCRYDLQGNDAILTVDDLGNFVSLLRAS